MIVSPIEAAKNTVIMKDSNYSHHKINKQSKSRVNIINSRPKAAFFKWPSKIYKGPPKDGWLAGMLLT